MRIGVTGHQQLSGDAMEWVRRELTHAVGAHLPAVGITCLAAGTDQVFADVVLALRGELIVYVPFARYRNEFPDEESRAHYEALLSRAAEVTVMSMPESKQEAYLLAGRRVVEKAELVVAVWDGRPARGLGGTADIVEYAQSLGRPITILNPITFQTRML
jgi:hypothetical protein